MKSRDRGAPYSLRRDFVFSSADHTFNVDVSNGEYQVRVVLGNQKYPHDRIDVFAEDGFVVNDFAVSAGQFGVRTFIVAVADNQLNLRFHEDGGSDINWIINSITIELGSSPPPIETPRIGVYSNSQCSEELSFMEWGNLFPEASNDIVGFVKNEGQMSCVLSLRTFNWVPSTAQNYLSLSWNYNGQTINPSEVVPITVIISVSPNITGIRNFTFDITLLAT